MVGISRGLAYEHVACGELRRFVWGDGSSFLDAHSSGCSTTSRAAVDAQWPVITAPGGRLLVIGGSRVKEASPWCFGGDECSVTVHLQ